MEEIVKEVYYDMPGLRKEALQQIKDHYRKPKKKEKKNGH